MSSGGPRVRDTSAVVGRPVRELETPLLVVDLDRFERNVATMRQVIVVEAGIRWRPHTKAIRVPALVHRLVQAGATGVACATVGEAEMLAAAGVQDIMIANQVVGAPKVARLVSLARQADLVVAVDCGQHLRALDGAAQAAGLRLRVVVEVNTGMGRAGVEPGEPAVELARMAAACRALRFAGVMGWEGGRIASIAQPDDKRRAIEAAVGRLTESAARCRAAGLPVGIVSCGGTGTYGIAARQPGVTEVQAGGGVFGDVYYRTHCGIAHERALTVVTTVISRPTPTRIICDAGWKRMAQHPAPPEPLDVGEVKSLTLSAEHATIELAAPRSSPAVGAPVEFVAGYSDATVFLHDVLYGVRAGRVEAAWPIPGRGRLGVERADVR
jgi:D-serine deaminase-like pyridoxal phosphate-dependent protein